jgi:hypothetical protein
MAVLTRRFNMVTASELEGSSLAAASRSETFEVTVAIELLDSVERMARDRLGDRSVPIPPEMALILISAYREHLTSRLQPAAAVEAPTSVDETQDVHLNGRMVTLSGLALEVMRTMDKDAAAQAKASFDRGFSGAKRADADRIAMIIQEELRVDRGHLENVSYVAVKIAESIERSRLQQEPISPAASILRDQDAMSERLRGALGFTPDWELSEAETLAVNLSIALHRHVPGWGGATDEQLDAVAKQLIGAAAAEAPTSAEGVIPKHDDVER